MAMSIKNPEVERLVEEIARMTGERKTEVLKKSLILRKKQLEELPRRSRKEQILAFLQEYVWPSIPEACRGKAPSREEREQILGY
ncbi:MAG: hypothetical protein Kow009_00100 [Spirochaetales bacterium]